MSAKSSPALIEYMQPPVIEVVCGVLFEPLEKLLAPYLGLLWEHFRKDYPTCQEAPPLLPSIETPEGQTTIEFQIAELPLLPRIWFVHEKETGIIQVQRDRFLHNWKKVSDNDPYPRYHNVVERFRHQLLTFETFLRDHHLGEVKPIQLEMTYINHILKGEGWESLADIGKLFPDFAPCTKEARALPETEGIAWRKWFSLPDGQGRLYLNIRNALRREDSHPLLVFELTARGIGKGVSHEELSRWFDLAHEWIVKSFISTTALEVQQSIWRRTQ